MPTKGSYRGVKGNQGAQMGYGSPGNIKTLPRDGATDKSGKKPPTGTARKGREIARKGRG
jgi:hypothetical protein